jgi:hypothetical protein
MARSASKLTLLGVLLACMAIQIGVPIMIGFQKARRESDNEARPDRIHKLANQSLIEYMICAVSVLVVPVLGMGASIRLARSFRELAAVGIACGLVFLAWFSFSCVVYWRDYQRLSW